MGQDQEVVVFSCGGPCKDGQPHQWDGPVLEGGTPNGGSFETGTCSKCGLDQMSFDLMTLDESKSSWDRLLEDNLDSGN
jgi:hypothetical protein